jgi:hypothetical protein
MNDMRSDQTICGKFLPELDAYLSRTLPAAAVREMTDHLSSCPDCSAEVDLRRAVRTRLRTAADSVAPPPFLETRIRASVGATRQKRSWSAYLAPVAAVAVLFLGVGIAYQVGLLRFTADSQEAYARSVTGRVPVLLAVGLGDHIHCSLFRKYASNAPKVEHLTQDLGPQYAGLIPVMNENIPPGYSLMMAHQCRYHGRRFVHLTLKNDGKLLSLVIAKKSEGESFSTAGLPQALSQAGVPFYTGSVQRFEIASFETKDHLVYIVSNMPRDQNTQLMLAMAPGIRTVLTHLEG